MTLTSPKRGISIFDAIKDMRPLDVILVKSSLLFPKVIAYTQAFELKCPEKDTFSHAGIIISRDVVNDNLLEPGKLYLWESCLTHGVYSIHHPNKKFLGSQVRPLAETLTTYDEPHNNVVGWLRVKPRHRPAFSHEFRRTFTEFFNSHNNVCYDFNPLNLCAAVFKKLRPTAHLLTMLTGSEKLMFCSELVATTLIISRVFPPSNKIKPCNVLPQDFLGYDNETDPQARIPSEVFRDIVLVTTTPVPSRESHEYFEAYFTYDDGYSSNEVEDDDER